MLALLFSSFILHPSSLPAATVWGYLPDISLAPQTTKLTFSPTNQAYLTSAGLVASGPKTVDVTKGYFTNTLAEGHHTTTFPLIPSLQPFGIDVPPGNGTYNITNLLSSPKVYSFVGLPGNNARALLADEGTTPEKLNATELLFDP